MSVHEGFLKIYDDVFVGIKIFMYVYYKIFEDL